MTTSLLIRASLVLMISSCLSGCSDWRSSIGLAPLDLIPKGVVFSLPPPPADPRVDLDSMLALRSLRTPERVQEIKLEQSRIIFRFKELIQSSSRPGRLCGSTEILLLDTVTQKIEPALFGLKKSFNRIRPAEIEPSIAPVIPVPWHKAYPSGHATQGYLLALLLSEIAPELRSRFLAQAERIAQNREIAGLHYPSDSAAGRLLAGQFFDVMMKNASFVRKLHERCASSSLPA